MRSVEVTLGGKPYTVSELPTRLNAAWRKELQGHFGALVALLSNAPATKLAELADVGTLITAFSGQLIGSIDTITELVLAYMPGVDKKKLGDAAYDSEILEAFAKILTLAFPFGVWGDKALLMIQQISRLSANKPTTTS